MAKLKTRRQFINKLRTLPKQFTWIRGSWYEEGLANPAVCNIGFMALECGISPERLITNAASTEEVIAAIQRRYDIDEEEVHDVMQINDQSDTFETNIQTLELRLLSGLSDTFELPIRKGELSISDVKRATRKFKSWVQTNYAMTWDQYVNSYGDDRFA